VINTLTKSPCLALRAIAGSNAACKMHSPAQTHGVDERSAGIDKAPDPGRFIVLMPRNTADRA